MMKKALLLALLPALLIVCACTATRFKIRRDIDFIELVELIPSGVTYDKALADPITGSVFALQKSDQLIHVYKNGKRVNSIGGLGSQSYNFQRLSDITLDNDGSLLALDTGSRELRRFSSDGQLLARLDLSRLIQPELAAMSADRELFIYDAAPQEVVSLSMFDASELHRFGRFQILAPSAMSCSPDFLSIYSAKHDETQLYYLLGQLKDKLDGQYLIDGFGNLILAGSASSDGIDTTIRIPSLSGSGLATIYRDYITIVHAEGIAIHRIHYGELQP